MKKILVIGSTGTLGLSLCKIIKNLNNYEIIELSRKSKKNPVDITNKKNLISFFKNYPTINCYKLQWIS